MTGPAMTIVEVAAELGRAETWMRDHWRELVAREAMPAPVNGIASGALVWSRAQIYAWLDRELTQPMQIASAAYRAAAAAAAGIHHTGGEERSIADHRARLDRKYGRT